MPKQKIHIGKNGPALCDATKRACHYGGEQEHYDNMAEAAKAYEEQLAQEQGGSFGSSTQSKKNNVHTVNDDDIAQEAAQAMNSANNGDELDSDEELKARFSKVANLNNPEVKKYAQSIASMSDEDIKKERFSLPHDSLSSELLDEEEAHREKKARNQPSVSGKSSANTFKPAKDHSSPNELKYSLEEHRRRIQNEPDFYKKKQNHYSVNAGKLNPSNYEGSGADYIKQGKNSLVILSDIDGKGVRAISSWSDFYDNPEDEIGAPATQVKQYSNSPDKMKELIVVGYVSKDGEKTGYVPDKQISAFVYK